MKIDLGSCSCRVCDFEEISCVHELAVLRMLNLDTYFYVAEFYLRETLSIPYSGLCLTCGVHLDWRVEDDIMKILSPIIKRQVEKSRNR